MKRVAGYILPVIAFVINIPLQVGISVYGLIYVVRAFVDGNILIGIIAIPMTAVCVAVTRFAVGLALRPLNGLIAFLSSKTDVETTSRDEREWRRKQAEKGCLDRRRSITDAETQHIKESLQGH